MAHPARQRNYSDVHMTDPRVAKLVVDHFPIQLPALDPARGRGAFHDAMPAGTAWCEISDGVDFFAWRDPVLWIATNPPFGPLTRWMTHAFALADNGVFLIPLSKLFNSPPRMRLLRAYGGIREILYLGSGRDVGFHMGFAFGALWFQRGYRGDTRWTWADAKKLPQGAQTLLFPSSEQGICADYLA